MNYEFIKWIVVIVFFAPILFALIGFFIPIVRGDDFDTWE